MRKVFIFLLIVLCSGCFFNEKKIIECSSTNKVGEIKVTNDYKFIYRKEELKEIVLNISFDCKKDGGKKVYNKYVDIYKGLGEDETNLEINYNSEDCVIELNGNIDKNKVKLLNSLNLGFLGDVTSEELKDTLKSTEYQCK